MLMTVQKYKTNPFGDANAVAACAARNKAMAAGKQARLREEWAVQLGAVACALVAETIYVIGLPTLPKCSKLTESATKEGPGRKRHGCKACKRATARKHEASDGVPANWDPVP